MTGDPSSDPNDESLPLGRRARKAQAVRRALFEGGLASFERQPIALVSVLDITEHADVAKGVFYIHFRSKDEYLLELWTEVHRDFLNQVRSALGAVRSKSARIETVMAAYESFSRDAPASARFWIRMLGYFPDEIGPPGALRDVRDSFVRSLAGQLTSDSGEHVSAAQFSRALVLDSICWSFLATRAHPTGSKLDQSVLKSTVSAAVRAIRD